MEAAAWGLEGRERRAWRRGQRHTETERVLHAATELEPGSPEGVLWSWDRCPSSDSCQPPGMMGTQQVQRQGWRPKGNLRKQLGVGCAAQAMGPVPSSPSSDPPRHEHTYSCLPGLGLRAILASPGYTGVTIRTRQKGRNEGETRFRFPGQRVLDGARTHSVPSWQQTHACDKIDGTSQEGWVDAPTPPSQRSGAPVLRSDRQALLTHDWASY